MGKQIDFTKPLSKEDEAWLNERSRGWEVEEHKRRLEDAKNKDRPLVEDVEPQVPPYTVAAAPFDAPGPNPRQVPYPVGIDGEHVDRTSEAEAEVEEVDVEDLTVEELKEELHELGLPVSGNKDELVKRLKKADR